MAALPRADGGGHGAAAAVAEVAAVAVVTAGTGSVAFWLLLAAGCMWRFGCCSCCCSCRCFRGWCSQRISGACGVLGLLPVLSVHLLQL